MQITLPENISEITLGQFLKYEELTSRDMDIYNFNKRKLEIFTNVPFKQLDNIKQIDSERLLNQIDNALATEAEFTPIFEMHDMKFGFIPNLDKITLDEYSSLSSYGVDKNTLPHLMAVLFRPVVKQIGDKYEIMAYTSAEEYAELMKGMPLNCVNGALVFFYNLANELQDSTQRYLSAELRREMQPLTTSRISDGIQRLKNWQRTTYSTFRKYLNSKYTTA